MTITFHVLQVTNFTFLQLNLFFICFLFHKWWKYSRRDENDSVVSSSLYSPELLTSRGNVSRSFFLLVSTVFMQSQFLRVCITSWNCNIHMLVLGGSSDQPEHDCEAPEVSCPDGDSCCPRINRMSSLSTSALRKSNIHAQLLCISGRHTAPPAITTEVCDDRSQEPLFCRRTITSLFSKVTSRTHRRRWFSLQRLKWPPHPVLMCSPENVLKN